ncbi:MAG: carboxypeptidase regulatory-like domain-containing protein [Gemmatimonadaceae bacterium]
MAPRPLVVIALLALLARQGGAQVPDPAHRAPGTAVRGVVRDSIAQAPLAGAWVQLADADSQARYVRTVRSDTLGRFTIDSVPAGRYALGFFHPMLDSLGVEPTFRELRVQGSRAVQADLAIPSAARLRTAICGQADAGGALVIGIAREATARAPAAGVTVIGEWMEYTFAPGGIGRSRPRRVATTAANGWFSMCNVPSGGTMFLSASRGADTTDQIEVAVPATGFQRRDVYLGAARIVVTGEAASRADSLPPPVRLRLGDGRLRGVVVTADGSRPLPGALVRISDGPTVRANELGEWTLVDAPAGTRMLEVRAVGYYPVRRAVDVVPDAAPVRVTLSTFKAMLDTVRITAVRVADRFASGFEERQRSGRGHFLTADDIMRRGAVDASDVFKNLPGVRIYDGGIFMRSAFKPGGAAANEEGSYACKPMFYVNGLPMFDINTGELDATMRARNIRAVEIYDEASVPPQFQLGMSGCGAIVIWTK